MLAGSKKRLRQPMKYSVLTDTAKHPVRKHPYDAGVDVFADENVTIPPFRAGKVKTGVTFDIDNCFMLLAKPKSGTDLNILAGVIDPGYQGEIIIKIGNYTDQPLEIKQGQPLAQLVQVAIFTDTLEHDPDLHNVASIRGATGGIHKN